MKRCRAISFVVLLGAAALSATGCGSTLRDVFYSSRQPGITPVRDDGASAALFRSNDPQVPSQTFPSDRP